MIAKNIINLIIVYILLLFNNNIISAAIGSIISNLFILIILFINITPKLPITIPNFSLLKNYLKFGIPLIPSYLSNWIVNSSDRYLITLMLGINFVGFYNPAYSLGMILILFVSPISFLFPVILSKYFDFQETDSVRTVIRYSIKYFLVLSIPLIFFLSINSRYILKILTTDLIAENSYMVVPFIAISALFYGIYTIMSNVIIIHNKTIFIAKIWLIAGFLNIILNIFLIQYLNILGAALSTLICFLFIAISVTLYSSKLFYIDYSLKTIFKTIFISLIVALFLLIMPLQNFGIFLFEIVFYFLLVFILLFYFQIFSKIEIEFMKINFILPLWKNLTKLRF